MFNKNHTYITLSLILALALLPACQSSEDPPEATASSEASAATPAKDDAKAKITNIHTLKVRLNSFDETIKATGQVEPLKDVTVSSEMSGKIQWLGIKEGQYVKKGALMARLDASLLLAQKNQALANYRLSQSQEKWSQKSYKGQLAQAKVNWGSQNIDFGRQKQLLGEKVVSKKSYDNVEANLKNAKISLDLQKIALRSNKEVSHLQTVASQSNLRVTQANLSKAYVYAPHSGYINQVNVEQGEVLSPGAPLAQLVQMGQIKVVAGISEKDIGSLKVGTLANIRFDALSGDLFTGPVAFIGAVADPKSKTFPVKVILQNPGYRIKAGMIGRLEITKKSYENAIVIPLDTIIERETERIVMVEENGIAKERKIKLGATHKAQVQILSGLKANDNLIVFGHRNLSDKDQVKVLNPSAAPKGQAQ